MTVRAVEEAGTEDIPSARIAERRTAAPEPAARKAATQALAPAELRIGSIEVRINRQAPAAPQPPAVAPAAPAAPLARGFTSSIGLRQG